MRRLQFTDQFHLDAESLDRSVRLRVLKAVDKILVKPELGKPLGNDLAGQCSERVGGWRVFYRFDNEAIVLLRCKKRDEAY